MSDLPPSAAAPAKDGLNALEQRQAKVPWEALHRWREAIERWQEHGSAFAKPLDEAIREVGGLWASREGGSRPDEPTSAAAANEWQEEIRFAARSGTPDEFRAALAGYLQAMAPRRSRERAAALPPEAVAEIAELKRQRLLLAKLAHPAPQFYSPAAVWEARKIRDEALRAAAPQQEERTK